MKRVLIIQPTITHYRLPFFGAIERLRPAEWEFAVTFDPTELTSPRFQQNPLTADMFHFPTADVKHVSVPFGGKRLEYQTAFKLAASYDLIVAEHAVRDLAYLLTPLHKLHGAKFAYWGHGRDRALVNPKGMKAFAERFKTWLALRMDGYFAYTPGVAKDAVSMGIPQDRVFVLNNTIDILEQRRAYDAVRARRDDIRREFGVGDGPVLLFVGRFTSNKRLDFLAEAFTLLRREVPSAYLFLVGDGNAGPPEMEHVIRFGSVESLDELAPIYAASDLLTFPGAVGLGPLQALCYDVPVITIESPVHNPEVEYLTPSNSAMLPADTSPRDYATYIGDLLRDADRLRNLREATWPSIEHLTVDAMASNFITGVNTLLGVS